MPPYGPSSAPWGTHAKQGNRRIRAQELCHSSVYGCRKGLFISAEAPCQSRRRRGRTKARTGEIVAEMPIGHGRETWIYRRNNKAIARRKIRKHALAGPNAVLSLELAGKMSMLHASLAPPPQARQRGRRILSSRGFPTTFF